MRFYIVMYFFTFCLYFQLESSNCDRKTLCAIDIRSGDKEYEVTCLLEHVDMVHYFLMQKTDYKDGFYIIKEEYIINYQLRDIAQDPQTIDVYQTAFRNLRNALKRYLKKYIFVESSFRVTLKRDVVSANFLL